MDTFYTALLNSTSWCELVVPGRTNKVNLRILTGVDGANLYRLVPTHISLHLRRMVLVRFGGGESGEWKIPIFDLGMTD